LWHAQWRMKRSARGILENLVRTPSETGGEQAAAQAFAGWCEEAGMEVAVEEVEPDRCNVVARWNVGRRPHLLLTGHLDTAPVGEGWTRDPLGAEVSGGRLYGRGACDMKGGLAAMLGAIFELRRRGEEPAGDVTLAAVAGEEEDSAGTRALVGRGIRADMAVLSEPTAMQLVISNRGLLNFRVVVKGASAHASAPALGRNAITAAAAVVVELQAVNDELARRPHAVFGPASLTVGTIHGGTRPYVVPDRCVIELDRRQRVTLIWAGVAVVITAFEGSVLIIALPAVAIEFHATQARRPLRSSRRSSLRLPAFGLACRGSRWWSSRALTTSRSRFPKSTTWCAR